MDESDSLKNNETSFAYLELWGNNVAWRDTRK